MKYPPKPQTLHYGIPPEHLGRSFRDLMTSESATKANETDSCLAFGAAA